MREGIRRSERLEGYREEDEGVRENETRYKATTWRFDTDVESLGEQRNDWMKR